MPAMDSTCAYPNKFVTDENLINMIFKLSVFIWILNNAIQFQFP